MNSPPTKIERLLERKTGKSLLTASLKNAAPTIRIILCGFDQPQPSGLELEAAIYACVSRNALESLLLLCAHKETWLSERKKFDLNPFFFAGSPRADPQIWHVLSTMGFSPCTIDTSGFMPVHISSNRSFWNWALTAEWAALGGKRRPLEWHQDCARRLGHAGAYEAAKAVLPQHYSSSQFKPQAPLASTKSCLSHKQLTHQIEEWLDFFDAYLLES